MITAASLMLNSSELISNLALWKCITRLCIGLSEAVPPRRQYSPLDSPCDSVSMIGQRS